MTAPSFLLPLVVHDVLALLPLGVAHLTFSWTRPRETLENQAHLRDNGPVMAGQGWVDGRQATRLL